MSRLSCRRGWEGGGNPVKEHVGVLSLGGLRELHVLVVWEEDLRCASSDDTIFDVRNVGCEAGVVGGSGR